MNGSVIHFFFQPEAQPASRFILTSVIQTPMNDRELALSLWRRYAAAQTPLGRCLLSLHVQHQRARAHWQANGPALVKRACDVLISASFLVLLSPLFLLITLAVLLEDGGQVFFAQTRVGKDGREFKMYKIRSMCLGAEEQLEALLRQNQHPEGVTFKIKDDPRITRVGKWLRKFSFDELPQLYNVLIGEMSLVGPRPPLPREVAKYSPADRRRLAIKPGITCVWQISGRSEIDFSGQVRLDVDYIENQSFWTDLGILARTVPAVLAAKGAC